MLKKLSTLLLLICSAAVPTSIAQAVPEDVAAKQPALGTASTPSAASRPTQWAIKSNLLYDATATVNLGVEFAFAPKWSFDLNGSLNAWRVESDRTWKHWFLQPELRYWFCEAIHGHFVGAHLIGGQYNIGGLHNDFPWLGLSDLSKYRYQGWMAGLGVAYGYSWILGRHWNIEAEIGLGYIYTRYDKFPCAHCGNKLERNKPHHYVGPTKAAINIIYAF